MNKPFLSEKHSSILLVLTTIALLVLTTIALSHLSSNSEEKPTLDCNDNKYFIFNEKVMVKGLESPSPFSYFTGNIVGAYKYYKRTNSTEKCYGVTYNVEFKSDYGSIIVKDFDSTSLQEVRSKSQE